MLTLDISKVAFEERVDNEAYGTTTLYFLARKEVLGDKYPEAEHATISIEFDFTSGSPRNPTVMISPTADGLDYDWYDAELDPDILEKLIRKGLSHCDPVEAAYQILVKALHNPESTETDI